MPGKTSARFRCCWPSAPAPSCCGGLQRLRTRPHRRPKIASAAEAASRPARSLEEFRRRAKQRELEAQRQALRGSEPEPEPVPVAAAPAPLSDDELKLAIRSHFERARDAYLQSIALRPAWPAVWARLAGVHLALEQREPYLKAWNQALKLGPHESNVQAECLELVLIDWDQAQPAQHEWAKKLYDDASESKRKAINRVAARFGLLFEAEEVPAPR
jgi:tetratricopeptide (TPR) repeat protein